MKKYIIVKADTNDADYVMEKSEITDEQIEQLKPLIEAIKNFQPYETITKRGNQPRTHRHNFPCGEFVREDLGEKDAFTYYLEQGISEDVLEMFCSEFAPSSENGIHTIISIEIIVVQEEIKLL
jgi:hypothetical protein